MKITLAGEGLELRNGLVLECVIGEPVLLPAAVDAVALRSGPAGSTPSWADGAITIHSVGRHSYWLTVNGQRMDLELVACEPELMQFLGAQQRSLGHGGGERSTPRVRRIMRSLAQHPSFSGRVADVTGSHPELVPSAHGA